MHPVSATEDQKRAIPCLGLVDTAGDIRNACRVCGKCDDLIRDMMRDIVAVSILGKQTMATATA